MGRPPLSLVVRGTARQVEEKLLAISAVVQYRKVAGWDLFQPDEEWYYVIRPDLGEVCPVCEAFAGVTFSGDQIPIVFPHKELWTTSPYIVLPRTHMPNLDDFGGEPCHCELHLQNAAETMERRLHEEKLAVI